MSEYASLKNRGKMVSLVFAMQGTGLVVGPLLAIVLLATGISHDLVWRLLLAFGAIPAMAVFWLRRQIRETPPFLLAQSEAEEAAHPAQDAGKAAGIAGSDRGRAAAALARRGFPGVLGTRRRQPFHGLDPRSDHRSEPHAQVADSRMMASVGSTMAGSARLSRRKTTADAAQRRTRTR